MPHYTTSSTNLYQRRQGFRIKNYDTFKKESVIFVIPESDNGDCSEVGDALSWDASSNADLIFEKLVFIIVYLSSKPSKRALALEIAYLSWSNAYK